MPEITTSLLLWSGGIIVALIGVIAAWRKTEAEAAGEITSAARDLVAEYKERIERLEEKAVSYEKKMDAVQLEASQLKRENRTLRDRVSSLEENDRITRLAMETLEGEYKSLQTIMKDWHAGIMILIAQIERHDSSPEWRPKDE